MRIAICSTDATSEYPLHLANPMAEAHDVTVYVPRSHLVAQFPGVANYEVWLKEKKILHPAVRLRLVDYAAGGYLKKPFWALRFVREIGRTGVDVLHYHSGGNPWVPLVLPALGRAGRVVSIHDATPHTGDVPPPSAVHLVNRIVALNAHQIIVHGRQQATALQEMLRVPAAKVNVVPLGGYSMFRTLSTTPVEEDPRLVLFFGRIRPYKGLQYLLEAAEIAAQEVPDIRVMIAGGGKGLEEFQDRLANTDRYIVRHGFIPVEEVAQLFQRAALVALPYTDASQSGVAPLAYIFGKPVVSSRVGSIPEVLTDGETGYLVEPRDSRQLADALVKLLKDPALRHRMGENARRRASTDLSWDHIAEKTLTVYERAVSRRVRSVSHASG